MPANDQTKVRLDQFISRVVQDPKNPGDALLITGFLGASSEPEHTRLYFDASLSNYVDVATNDIVHTEPLPKEQSPLGGSYIWLKRDAQAVFGKAGADRTKAKFFEGPVMAAYGGQFGGAGAQAGGAFQAAGWGGFGGYGAFGGGGGGGFGGGAGGIPPSSAFGCPPTQFCPPTHYHCSFHFICRSWIIVCQTEACQLQSAVCAAPGAAGMAAQFGGGAAAGAPGANIPIYTAPAVCQISPWCPSVLHICPTAVCSHHIYCYTPACPVLTAFCPVQTATCPVLTPGCPIETPGCPIQSAGCPQQPGPAGAGGIGGGGFAGGAQYPQFVYPPTVFCRSVYYPCFSQHHPCTPGCPM